MPTHDEHAREHEDDHDKPMQIGRVSELTGVSLNTLRHWDEVGLLSPSSRSEGGFRLYSRHDVERLLVIRRMKPLGFSLDQMAEVMAIADVVDDDAYDPGHPRSAELEARLKHYLDVAEESRRSLTRKLAMAEEFVGLMRERHQRATAAGTERPPSV